MRRHFALYFKCIPDFRETRLKLLTAQTVEEIQSILNYIEDRFGNVGPNDFMPDNNN